MISRLIYPRESAFEQVKEEIKKSFGRDPELLGLSKESTYVIGRFDGNELTGFGIFEDYKDPKFHVGNTMDEGFKKRVQVLDNYMLYNISLIHEFAGKEDPSETAKGVIQTMHDILGIKNGRFCLYITLMKEANAPAIGFFESLGFTYSGNSSVYMSIPIVGSTPVKDRWEFLPVSAIDPSEVARAYVDVFDGDIDWFEAIRMILSTKGFDMELSFVGLDKQSRDVAGFCLVQRSGPGELYIMAVGVRPEYRGKGLTLDGYHYLQYKFKGANIGVARLVTASRKLADYFSKNLGAEYEDELLWYSLCK